MCFFSSILCPSFPFWNIASFLSFCKTLFTLKYHDATLSDFFLASDPHTSLQAPHPNSKCWCSSRLSSEPPWLLTLESLTQAKAFRSCDRCCHATILPWPRLHSQLETLMLSQRFTFPTGYLKSSLHKTCLKADSRLSAHHVKKLETILTDSLSYLPILYSLPHFMIQPTN